MAMQFVLTAWATEPGQSACGALGASPSDNLPAAPTAPTQNCVNPVLRPPETRQSLMGCLSKECMWGRSISWFHRERWFSSSVRFSSTSTAKDGEAFAVHLQPPPLHRQLLQWAFNKPWWCRATNSASDVVVACRGDIDEIQHWIGPMNASFSNPLLRELNWQIIRNQYLIYIHSFSCNTSNQFSFLQSWNICAPAEPIMLSLLCEDSYAMKYYKKKGRSKKNAMSKSLALLPALCAWALYATLDPCMAI